jgi:predicted Zn-dependent peptidase
LPVREVQPRYLDFEKDVSITPLTPLVKLYASANPVNNIFTLDISFATGQIDRPELAPLTSYLPLLGTDQLSFDDFRGRLQTLGSTLTFEIDNNRFVIKVSGFDANFNETLALVSSFMQNAKPEDKKVKKLADEESVAKKTFFKSTESIAQALLETVRYGDKSIFRNKLSLKDISKMKGQDLLASFKAMQQVACDLYYCGTLPPAQVANIIKETLRIEDVTIPAQSPAYRHSHDFKKPQVFFCNVSDASQSIIYSYINGNPSLDEHSRHAARLFSAYFGGDMSSLMFQEIREFRSYAYRAQGRYSLPPLNLNDKPGAMTTVLSTQNDKVIDALVVLDSLLHNMPVRPERLPAVKQSLINQMSASFPAFRKIPARVAAILNEGYLADPIISIMEKLPQMEMNDIVKFYDENIKGKPIVYVIVGNARKIDMSKLEAFGEVYKINKETLYN